MNMPPQQPPYGQQPLYGQQPPYGQPMYAPPPGYAPPPPPRVTSQWGPSSIGMDPNVAAGLGYLVSIVAIIFFFMEKQNRFVRFHTAQAILLTITYLILFGLWYVGFFVVIIGGSAATTNSDPNTANAVAGLGLVLLMLCLGVVVLLHLVMWIWGMVAAFTGRVVKFPLIGAIAQRWAGGPVVPVMPFAPYMPPPPAQ